MDAYFKHPLVKAFRRLRLSTKSRSLILLVVLAATGAIFGSTPAVASGAPSACPSSEIVPSKLLPRFYPPHVDGDREFEGHGPAITVSAKRERWDSSPDFLAVVLRMRAEETQSDWTKAEGSRSYVLYTAPAGCNIDPNSLTLGAFDSNGYLARSSYANPYNLNPGDTGLSSSFVLRYTVWDDQSGSDVNEYTSVQLATKSFTVRFTN